ncbi:MAG: thiamine diphosphokinase [Lachnospiraceae bacterium]|nr:thiamine diphosphokinase [Lachnospiraceae bacterium]
MKRCVIVGGAKIGRYDRILPRLRKDDYLIYCDGGLGHREALGREPDLIIGDFDSYDNPQLDIETIVLPCVKDDTDSAYAVREGIRRGFDEFLLLGAAGGRMDHTLGNLSLLIMLERKGKKAVLLDDYSEMEIVSREPAFVEDRFSFFSLLNISGLAEGVEIKNAKYPLHNAGISCDYQYGISNEVLPGKTAEIRVGEGELLLIRIFRD